jgi:hypothetical protein
MSVLSELSNHFKYRQAIGHINFAGDDFRVCLMDTTFVFDKDTHATYSDISAYELPTGGGYTQGGLLLAPATVVEDDENNRVSVTWGLAQWLAAGGNIGPTIGAIVYDDTTIDDTVIGYIRFAISRTAVPGKRIIIYTMEYRGD